MQTIAGLWIDHRRAVIVTISDKGQKTRRITSSIEKQLRGSGRSHPRSTYKSRGAAAGDSREREYRGQPAAYYDEIVAGISAATTILIFGPGEAKHELKKRMERNADDKRLVRVETAGEMTDEQIVEKVRKQFSAAGKSPAPTWDTTPPEDMNCEG
jgi:stalled ribosome rescue protein Dom34